MIKTSYQNEVISRIRKLRLDNRMSQIELANIIEVSSGQIGNIESPKFSHKYTIKHLYQISKYFGVSFEYLMTGENVPLNTENMILNLIRYDE